MFLLTAKTWSESIQYNYPLQNAIAAVVFPLLLGCYVCTPTLFAAVGCRLLQLFARCCLAVTCVHRLCLLQLVADCCLLATATPQVAKAH